MIIENEQVRIELAGEDRGGLLAFTDLRTGRNFIAAKKDPLYSLTLSQKGKELVELTSRDAESVDVDRFSDGEGDHITLTYGRHGAYDIGVTCEVLLEAASSLSRWRIAVRNNTSYGVRSIRYPVVVSPTILGETSEDDYFIWGLVGGQLTENPNKNLVSYSEAARGRPAPMAPQYPGEIGMQCQAYYDSRAGLYMATYDDTGAVKTFGVERIEGGFDLSIKHHFNEAPGLSFELPYETILGTFHGDWYTAADIYRAWATKQHWCSKKTIEREDIPGWVKESHPWPFVICRGDFERARGSVKSPPSEWPISRYFPAMKTVPIMREYARIFESPLVIFFEGFEKIGTPAGPVDIFPPYEGAESFKAAMDQLRQDGHVPLAFLGGFQWAYRRPTVGYEGRERFEREGKPLAVVNDQGGIDEWRWGTQHKIAAFLCVGSEEAQSIFIENLMKLMDLSFVALSIDHQVGGLTPVCYSEKHDHPAGYGPWMYKCMLEFLRKARKVYRERNPETTFSFESPCEMWIQEIDLHLHRPYGIRPFGHFTVPFFDYVYHEYALTYGGDGMLGLAHPEVELIKHAKVLTLGLQNLINVQQYEWDYEVDPNYPALTLMRNIVKAQRTYAHDYLLFGQMLKPTKLDVEKAMIDIYAPTQLGDIAPDLGQIAVPTVMHGVWKSPAGKIGYIMANWTGERREVTLELVEPGGRVTIVTENKTEAIAENEANSGKVKATLEPRGVALIEQELT